VTTKVKLQDSLQKLNDQLVLAREENNQILIKNLLKIISCLKEKINKK